MQTFLPDSKSFYGSLVCLDYKRLGNQRKESRQILDILLGINPNSRWKNHTTVLMWQGYEEALKLYYNLSIILWKERGYVNNMKLEDLDPTKVAIFPWWFGWDKFHDSHKSNLLRKDSNYYRQFNWDVPNNLPYIWPVKYMCYTVGNLNNLKTAINDISSNYKPIIQSNL